MTSHRIDQPVATFCASIVVVAFTAWVIRDAIKNGRVNTAQWKTNWVYRDAHKGKFWTYLFFLLLMFVVGLIAISISIEDLFR